MKKVKWFKIKKCTAVVWVSCKKKKKKVKFCSSIIRPKKKYLRCKKHISYVSARFNESAKPHNC